MVRWGSLSDHRLLVLSSHGGRGQELHGASYEGTNPTHQGSTPWPMRLPKDLPLTPLHWALGCQHVNLVGGAQPFRPQHLLLKSSNCAEKGTSPERSAP